MIETPLITDAEMTTFTDAATGRQLGVMWKIKSVAGPRWVAEVHDFNGEHGNAEKYDPINLGVFADDAQARAEIAEHVRKYSDL